MLLTAEQLNTWNQSPRILAVTGHRPDKLNREYDLQGPCSDFLRKNISECLDILQPRRVLSGMALGVDQLFALTAIEKNVKVIAAIPCDGQDSKWPKKSQDLYHSILQNPLVTSKVISPGPYHISKMQIRNCWLVDNSDFLLAVWDGSDGGTSNCVGYARSVNKSFYQLDPTGYNR